MCVKVHFGHNSSIISEIGGMCLCEKCQYGGNMSAHHMDFMQELFVFLFFKLRVQPSLCVTMHKFRHILCILTISYNTSYNCSEAYEPMGL